MRLHELFEELDKYGIYGKPASAHSNEDGSSSPLTGQGDSSWLKSKRDIYNWFKRPFLTNGPKNNYRLPIKKRKAK